MFFFCFLCCAVPFVCVLPWWRLQRAEALNKQLNKASTATEFEEYRPGILENTRAVFCRIPPRYSDPSPELNPPKQGSEYRPGIL
jgi:hypothetical protein